MIEYKSRSLTCGRNPDGSWTSPEGDVFHPVDIVDGKLVIRNWPMGVNPTRLKQHDLPSPIEPTPKQDGRHPRSEIYTEVKIRNDYAFFCKDCPGFDPQKPIGQIQQELFGLFKIGVITDETQAFEWLLARKWDEWDVCDRDILRKYATPEGKRENLHIWYVK